MCVFSATEKMVLDLSGRWLIRVHTNSMSSYNMLSASSKDGSEFLVVRAMLRLAGIGLSCSYGFMQIFSGESN